MGWVGGGMLSRNNLVPIWGGGGGGGGGQTFNQGYKNRITSLVII